jgi:hypothetical protein
MPGSGPAQIDEAGVRRIAPTACGSGGFLLLQPRENGLRRHLDGVARCRDRGLGVVATAGPASDVSERILGAVQPEICRDDVGDTLGLALRECAVVVVLVQDRMPKFVSERVGCRNSITLLTCGVRKSELSCGEGVFVDHAAESVSAIDPVSGVRGARAWW